MFLILLLTLGQIAVCLPGLDIRATAESSRITESGYWIELPPMTYGRFDHTMHVFQNDTIMVIGGTNGSAPLSSVEFYDPYIGEWDLGPSMSTARYGHASVKLLNNTIFVLGGYDGAGDVISKTEMYLPSISKWIDGPDLPFPGGGANLTASVLLNGSILVLGGNSGNLTSPSVIPQATIFDVTNSTWSNVEIPQTGAMDRKMFKLFDQTILTVGGSSGSPWYDGTPYCQVYDHVKEKWETHPGMTVGRYMFDGSIMGSGNVIVTGGIRQLGPGFDVVDTTEIFNSSSNAWESGPQMLKSRYGHTTTLLGNGELLVAGGQNETSIHNTTEVIETRNGISVQGPSMSEARTRHASIKTNLGRVLISGGLGTGGALTSVELFTPGIKNEGLSLEVFGATYTSSEGDIQLSSHTYNETSGDVPGVLVTFGSTKGGSFDNDWGLSDGDGVVVTTYHAPRNTGTATMALDISITTHKRGFTAVSRSFSIQVYPESKGEGEQFNDTITHLAYVTTYGPGSPFTNDSNTHSGFEFIGDEVLILDGIPTVVANISYWERSEKTFQNTGSTNIYTSEENGTRYYDYNLQGTVLSTSTKTVRAHILKGSLENWHNTTEDREIRYIPAKRGFDPDIPVMGAEKEIVNTYIVNSSIRNLDTGAINTMTSMETDYQDFILTAWKEVDTFMGKFETHVFVDETGLVYDYYSKEKDVLVQSLEFNETGKQASSKVLYEYNSLKGEDPTDPLLEVNLTLERPNVIAGRSTTLHAQVTSEGIQVEGAKVEILSGPGGVFDVTEGFTDMNGSLNILFTADRGSGPMLVNFSVLVGKGGHRSTTGGSVISIIEDITKPTINHRPIISVTEGQDIPVHALVMDEIGLSSVTLSYRSATVGTFTSLEMEMEQGAFEATIPAGTVEPQFLYYFLTAVDVNGNIENYPLGAQNEPVVIEVLPRLRYLPTEIAVLSGGTSISVNAAVKGNLSIKIDAVEDPGPMDRLSIGLFTNIEAIGDGDLVWANITFSYRDPVLGGINENELRVYRWGPDDWAIVPLSNVDTRNNLVWANITNLSIYAPRGLTPAPTLPIKDHDPPTVWILSPLSGAKVDEGKVSVSGSSSDNVEIMTIEIKIDNGAWFNIEVEQGKKEVNWHIDVPVPSGPHTISVRATDSSDNVGLRKTVDVIAFSENPTDGAGMRFNLLGLLSLALVMLIALYLLGTKADLARPDDPEMEHKSVGADQDSRIDTGDRVRDNLDEDITEDV